MGLIVNILAWVCVLVVALPATWRIVTNKGGEHDAVKFSYALVAVAMLGFSLRWLVAPDNMPMLEFMRGLSVALALFLLTIIRFHRSGN